MKQPVVYTIAFILALGLIACTQTFWLLAWGKSTIVFLSVVVALLMLDYSVAAILNIHILIPRLLLHSRYWAYTFSILGFVLIATGLDLFAEYWLIKHYHIEPGKEWSLSQGNWVFLYPISSITSYFISFVGTGIIFFLHLWNHSGRRLNDLKKQNTRNELDRMLTQIDSELLFDTLDEAADEVRRSPAKVTILLMELSKSLRLQLYESRQKQRMAQQEAPVESFNLRSPVLNFLIEKRYRLWRHLLLIIWFALIVSTNFDGSLHSFLFTLMVSLAIYLAMVYLNIYVLIPKLMMRGKKTAYFITAFLSFLVIIVLLTSSRLINIDVMENISPWFPAFFTVSNAIKLCFPIYGVIVIRLFQYWVRNQRRIAELETATMLSELEQLQNQVNPHFLFNMLNNIIVLTKTKPDEAAIVLRKLSDMLKYQFHRFAKLIRLGDDIRFLTDYLNLEKIRRDYFEFSITTEGDVEEILLPPLLFIPFVENAVKHSNDNRSLSFVRLRFTCEDDKLYFVCVNSKPLRPARKSEAGGLGLPNVHRRLDLLYGSGYHLEITENELVYTVQLSIEFKSEKI